MIFFFYNHYIIPLIFDIFAAHELNHFTMTAKNKNMLEKLHLELQNNNGIIPDHWEPFIPALKLWLRLLKYFTPDVIDIIIDILLEAIKIFEEASE